MKRIIEILKVIYFITLALFGKAIGQKQSISIGVIFCVISLLGGYDLKISLTVAFISAIFSFICNFPINKYLSYNLITGNVNMRLCDTKEFEGKTDREKAMILTNGYLDGIKLLQEKQFVRKIKFTTHKLVVLQLKRNLKKWGYTNAIVKEEFVESSPLKEKLFLYSINEFKNIDFKSILKNVDKYNIELKF